MYRGQLDIVSGNWDGEHRIFVKKENFKDIAEGEFKIPSKIRTVISADFDNDGYDEIFLNNLENKLFKIKENGELKEIDLAINSEPNGLGTGAAVAISIKMAF